MAASSHRAGLEAKAFCFQIKEKCQFFGKSARGGGSTVNRGHAHHRSIRRCRVREGRPCRFGGAQRDNGTCNDSSACIVQPWSVIPAAMAGVVCGVEDKLSWGVQK